MILFILGLLDLVAGLVIIFPDFLSFVAFYIGIIILLKGIFSFGTAALNNHWLDWMGAIDIITGISILTGFSFQYLWVLPVMKGVYTILMYYGGKIYL